MKSNDKWIKVVERRGQSILISSYFYNGIQTKYFKKTLDLNYGLDHYLIVDYSNYYLDSEVKNFQRRIAMPFKKTGFQYIKTALDKLFKKGEQLLRYSESINKIKNPVEAFEKFSKLCLEFGPAMYFPILIEEQVEKEAMKIISYRINDKDKCEEYFSILTASAIPTEGTKELISLYNIALAFFKNNKKFNKEIERIMDNHLKEYNWISFTKLVGDSWNKEKLIERIIDLNIKNIPKELDGLKNKYSIQKKQSLKIMTRYNFSSKELNLIQLAQLLAYFRTYRIDVYTKAGYNAKPLFELLAKNMGLTLQEFVFLTYKEILSYLKKAKKIPKDEVRKRLSEKWQLLFSEGRMNLSYNQPFLVETHEIIEQMLIKGQIASVGFATGEVKIIRGVLEFKKMKDKAVLVTSMTTPDFVPLMQRASAIVTDEGGITCHVAIVSRELKIPCVIGTKIATKVLKDDDIIE